MKFCWTTLHVINLEESLEFYQGIVGLEINRKFEAGPDKEIAFLGSGETQVELIDDKDKQDTDIGEDISLGFEVESVEKMMDFVQEKGITIHSGPFTPEPNIRYFFVQDPNGVKIQFVENVK